MTGVLEKQPNTKAYLLKTIGPSSCIDWFHLSELLVFRVEFLEESKPILKISQYSRDLQAL